MQKKRKNKVLFRIDAGAIQHRCTDKTGSTIAAAALDSAEPCSAKYQPIGNDE